ncbi:CysS/YqeB C-terminal domain-containing protein [Streptomyces sclerotialus]|uniref:CysS/YqeB C-terminal domain-containing protein n=1 Tax=Streptomyces sclerotialus TaxID=1957 RepID=UPI0004C7AB00
MRTSPEQTRRAARGLHDRRRKHPPGPTGLPYATTGGGPPEGARLPAAAVLQTDRGEEFARLVDAAYLSAGEDGFDAAEHAAQLREELAALGIVVREEKKQQYVRRAQGVPEPEA